MIPVPDNCLTQLKYNQVESFRSFSNEKERTDYVYLLQKEKALIDNVQDSLQNNAMKLYQKCIAKPDSSLAARCCVFFSQETFHITNIRFAILLSLLLYQVRHRRTCREARAPKELSSARLCDPPEAQLSAGDCLPLLK